MNLWFQHIAWDNVTRWLKIPFSFDTARDIDLYLFSSSLYLLYGIIFLLVQDLSSLTLVPSPTLSISLLYVCSFLSSILLPINFASYTASFTFSSSFHIFPGKHTSEKSPVTGFFVCLFLFGIWLTSFFLYICASVSSNSFLPVE